MSSTKMHDGERAIDAALVRQLLAAQFPAWADLPLARVRSAGTDNALFRLGDGLAVRLPRVGWAVGQVAKECAWLPRLAPRLPLAVPTPRAKGAPGDGYPWEWYVYGWLDGAPATYERLTNPSDAARALAEFVGELQRIDATDGPAAGEHNFGRGAPLATRDTAVRAALTALGDRVDTAAATDAWERALAAPVWECAPVWVHGDLHAGNLLASDGRLSAVIDFGGLGVGDPAVELMVAWNLFRGESRAAFRAALALDDAVWERGRGWALSMALIALPYYWSTNPTIVRDSLHTLEQVLADR